MKSYFIRQTVNIILLITSFVFLFISLRDKDWGSAIVDVMIFNYMTCLIYTEKKPNHP